MFRLKANTPRWVIILMDLFLSFIALAFAYLIRFDLKADKALIEKEWAILSKSILLYFGVKLVVFYIFKIHKGLVRYTSTEDIRRIFIFGIIRYNYFDGSYLFPTSVLIMEFLACFFLMVGSRFIVKLLYLESIKSTEDVEQILIYGAGISGLITKRTIEKDTRLNYKIIGFIDDNKKMDGTRLEGIGIFHSSKLESLIKEEGVTTVIIAIQKPNENNRKAIVETCLALNVKIQKVPSAKSWINGEFSTKQTAKINIQHLL